jgi:hypothetical protein
MNSPLTSEHSTSRYIVGTLVYSKLELFRVVFWMLLAVFMLQLMQQLVCPAWA